MTQTDAVRGASDAIVGALLGDAPATPDPHPTNPKNGWEGPHGPATPNSGISGTQSEGWDDPIPGDAAVYAITGVSKVSKPTRALTRQNDTLDTLDTVREGKVLDDEELLAGVRDGAWLDAQVFPALRYAVPGLIPEGFTILVGLSYAARPGLGRRRDDHASDLLMTAFWSPHRETRRSPSGGEEATRRGRPPKNPLSSHPSRPSRSSSATQRAVHGRRK